VCVTERERERKRESKERENSGVSSKKTRRVSSFPQRETDFFTQKHF